MYIVVCVFVKHYAPVIYAKQNIMELLYFMESKSISSVTYTYINACRPPVRLNGDDT